ncbi:hypothetical protein C8J56DRAFT_1170377 [Mycena floridula]|nr:hypothetical protein C8J56DRAFT_1170377 [Mycena floridula]
MTSARARIHADLSVVAGQLSVLRRREGEIRALLGSMVDEILKLELKEQELNDELLPLPNELMILIMSFVVAGENLDNSAPIILSQICRRWRNIALSTSELWSNICLNDPKWNRAWLSVFLKRSGTSPLTVVSDVTTVSPDEGILPLLDDNVKRVRLLTFHTSSLSAMQRVVDTLDKCPNTLKSLDLGLEHSDETPPLPPASSSLLNHSREWTTASTLRLQNSAITELKFHRIPLFVLSPRNLIALTTVHLSFPNDKRFRASDLLIFLSHTSRLQELVLDEATPVFDIVVKEESNSIAVSSYLGRKLNCIELLHLKRFEWSCPQPTQVQQLLSFIRLPALEKFDLWAENSGRATVHEFRDPFNKPLKFPSLTELSIQCSSESALEHLIRKSSFPALACLDITNFRRRDSVSDGLLPALPRFESIFRDPLLSNLTHLTLSHFNITPDEGKSTVMLGCLPALTSLSLDSCIGVLMLFRSLQQKFPPVQVIDSEKRTRAGTSRGIRFCPKLEAIALWNCKEVTFDSLLAFVQSRNGMGLPVEEVKGPLERTIRGLPKSRRMTVAHPAPLLDDPSADIVYVRLESCAKINPQQAACLMDMGVVDLLYN